MRLFVSNIDFAADEDELRDFFVENGYPPVSVRILLDRDTGASRGFGFVDIEGDDGWKAIADMNDQRFRGRKLKVKEALPEPAREPQKRYEYSRSEGRR